MHPPIPAEALKRMVTPFIEGGTRALYFTAVGNRVFVGKIRPTGTAEGEAPPPMITLEVPESGVVANLVYSDLAARLMQLREGAEA